ncbi:DUF6572 domain-containing protein [Cronobacter malonaticus]|uniref:Uncharacterized protein n=3 Tax=Cronobacter malonaticus TaxID=413503 RepID=A0ABX5JZH4_9ENTR|nr:DUF6572 domain-containing protein [Cronobacter malonaticus]ALX80664.1 hypothetical protein AFK66_023360 [Cronobacter malonaticus LMG 23826]EGT4290189.1 hypothetical protein [Cronobacter malonaticus]EGT4315459.1 hypothetical protein [Cronobacter malonaticus]EGT4373445.1 hypothetical protein [Cronobacter malonaticus]EGT4385556.1 hypothetical protein [Cronobacter malonaticus]
MSIEDVNKIDLFTVTSEEIYPAQAFLIITDHLEWPLNPNEHLFMLQEKINSYIAAVESGEVNTLFPESRGKDIVIKIYFQHRIPMECVDFLGKVSEVLSSTNIQLQYEESE